MSRHTSRDLCLHRASRKRPCPHWCSSSPTETRLLSCRQVRLCLATQILAMWRYFQLGSESLRSRPTPTSTAASSRRSMSQSTSNSELSASTTTRLPSSSARTPPWGSRPATCSLDSCESSSEGTHESLILMLAAYHNCYSVSFWELLTAWAELLHRNSS